MSNQIPAAGQWMIYGANGYTGGLIAREAVRRGGRPILAGRKRAEIETLAAELDCEARVFDLEQTDWPSALGGMRLVLNCAGPFSRTAAAMIDGCLQCRTHYLDVTGEIDVIEMAAGRDRQAREAGILLMPAVGFDVVPSDCLAKALAEQLPGATELLLAFESSGEMSPGTAKTVLQNLPYGGRARIDGRIQRVPAGWKAREVPFPRGTAWAMTVPWGDVASAYYSTGIKNIETYLALPRRRIQDLRRWRWLLPVLRIGWLRRAIEKYITRKVRGPSEGQRVAGWASFWGQASDSEGRIVSGTLDTPSGYQLTMLTALACVEKVLAAEPPIGFATPAQAFGKELILEIPGTDLRL
jgi:short subunit dehydrogenase-like uncharacterized protein